MGLAFWLGYGFLAFVVAPVIFRARYARWPYAYPLRRPDAYIIIDFAYGGATIAFTLYLVVVFTRSWELPTVASQAAGALLGGLAVALGAWAVVSLGPSWRIGQDRADNDVSRVMTGPYRIMRHPIYLALIALSIAMMLMAGATIGTIGFIGATLGYTIVQGANEDHHWRNRPL